VQFLDVFTRVHSIKWSIADWFVYCEAVLPNYDQCLDVGKQTIDAELGYISSAMLVRRGDRPAGGGGGGVAILAHGYWTTTTSSTNGLNALTDSLPPCPIELTAKLGQRINFTLFDFAPRNLSYPNTASQVDYGDDNLSKICHRSDTAQSLLFAHYRDHTSYFSVM